MRPLIRRCIGLVCVLLSILLMTGTARAASQVLSGTVTYDERIALPASAVLEVSLVDASQAEAAAKKIATTSIRIQRQGPVRYRLRFDDLRIQQGGRYALEAHISVGSTMWFVSTQINPVFDGGQDKTDMALERVGESASSHGPAGRWLAEDILGKGVIDNLQTVLEIAEDGAISGSGGCNTMTSRASISAERISIGPIASGSLTCTPAAMDQEAKFFAALREARTWKADAETHKLMLLNAKGRPIVVLSQM